MTMRYDDDYGYGLGHLNDDTDDFLKIPKKYREGMVRGPIVGEDTERTPKIEDEACRKIFQQLSESDEIPVIPLPKIPVKSYVIAEWDDEYPREEMKNIEKERKVKE